MKICITIVTFKNSQVLIDRLMGSIEQAIENITVNSSPEFSIAYINNANDLEFSSETITTIKLPTQGNIGYTKACNILWNHAFEKHDFDAVITANPDGMFFHDTLDELLKFHERFPNALIEATQFPEEHPKTFDPETYDTEWASGCCLLVNRAIFNTLGYLDDAFFLYMEDVDYSWRARLNKISVKICVNAQYAHDVIGRAPPSKEIICHMYQSGRELGAKWDNKQFQLHCEAQLFNESIFKIPTQSACPQEILSALFANSDAEITLLGHTLKLPKIIDLINKSNEFGDFDFGSEASSISTLIWIYNDVLPLYLLPNPWTINCELTLFLKAKNANHLLLSNLLVICVKTNSNILHAKDINSQTGSQEIYNWWLYVIQASCGCPVADTLDQILSDELVQLELINDNYRAEEINIATCNQTISNLVNSLPTALIELYNSRVDLQLEHPIDNSKGILALALWWLRFVKLKNDTIPQNAPEISHKSAKYSCKSAKEVSNFNFHFRFSDSRW
jgi:GT2 family glycosyltransferase